MSAENRLQQLGRFLPAASAPAGNYAAAEQTGNLLFLSGKAPSPVAGQLPQGKLGREYSAQDGRALARSACLELIAAIRKQLGSLDRVAQFVAQFVELHGALNTVPEFAEHAAVLGVASLRKGLPLTLKAIVEVKPA